MPSPTPESTSNQRYMCTQCGTQYAESDGPPAGCVICEDDRQFVAWSGQQWTSHAELAADHRNRIERDGDLLGIGTDPDFGINQRALLVTSTAGNVLWDCVSLVTDEVVEELNQRGGLDAIAISHPHFYSAMIEWSDAFGGIPVYLHRADQAWIPRRSPALELWDGDALELSSTVRLLHLPGHFPGSTALHWSDGPEGKQLLLAGDSLQVTADRAHVSLLHSVPNFLPVGPHVVRDVRARLDGVEFDDLYGFTWGLNILGGARAAVDASLDRFLAAISEPTPV